MPSCQVPGCTQEATFEVILYDVYIGMRDVFFEQDETCPYICAEHMAENEQGIEGVREPRGDAGYPYTNKGSAQGFTIYRPLNLPND